MKNSEAECGSPAGYAGAADLPRQDDSPAVPASRAFEHPEKSDRGGAAARNPDGPEGRPASTMPARSIEFTFRRWLVVLVLTGLLAGLLVAGGWLNLPEQLTPGRIWTVATLPVILVLAVSILRDFLIGRLGVDAIALVSMSAALALDQPLAGIVVALMYSGGVLLEDFARGRAERDLRALEDRSPKNAHRHTEAGLETIPVSQVEPDDNLLVRAGEIVPVDGELVDRAATLDESALTGEPLPVVRYARQTLRSGTVNAGDAFTMRAVKRAEQSTYAGILRLVAAAHTARAPFIRMADRFALLLLPFALVVSAGAWLLSGDPLRGLAVLVVATPCPLILAAPVAFIGGISRAARLGVLLKGSPALEALAVVKTAIFDKTGTLTLGGAELLDADFAPGCAEDDILHLAASLEQASRHVVALAIVEQAHRRHIPLAQPEEVREARGFGLSGRVDGRKVIVGSRSYVLSDRPPPAWTMRGESRFRGQPVLRAYVSLDGRLSAILTFGDAVRADARETMETLRSQGIVRFVLLTGDDEAAARRLAATLPFDRVEAHATPESKVEVLRDELARDKTMMIGDGINDAPALAAATVGVAMGARGATASSEAADMVVLPDRLLPVAAAVAVARRTRTIARQSVVAGLALSGLAMAAAAAGLITPVEGAFIQEGIDLAVILNALRALVPGRGETVASRLSRSS